MSAKLQRPETQPRGLLRAWIEVHVDDVGRLFHAIDPSPFREKDLDPDAEAFIVGWARDLPREAGLGLRVYVDRAAGLGDEGTLLRDAVQQFFTARAGEARRRLRRLLAIGRTSLAIGMSCLAVATIAGNFLAAALGGHPVGPVLRESLLVGAWVAMWRPIEIFLYDWWPIRAEARLLDRLAAMPVDIASAMPAGTARTSSENGSPARLQ